MTAFLAPLLSLLLLAAVLPQAGPVRAALFALAVLLAGCCCVTLGLGSVHWRHDGGTCHRGLRLAEPAPPTMPASALVTIESDHDMQRLVIRQVQPHGNSWRHWAEA